MKKQHKIVSLLLVISLLLVSFVFLVSADNGSGEDLGYTSVATKDTATLLSAIKYGATDNRLSYISLNSAATAGWGSDDARQSYVITNTETGDVYVKETSDGTLSAANEYVNYNFNSVNLKYDANYSEYVIAEYDIIFESLTGTYIDKGNTVNSENLKSQMIVRGSSAGTSWGNANIMYFKDYANPDKFVHITAVYDFTSGNEYVFVNGVLAATLGQGAFNDAVKAKYLAGETSITVSEIRVGSNSVDTLYLDNMYIRHEQNAVSSDTLRAAINSGVLSDWSNNIYTSSYDMPAEPWYVQPEFWSVDNLQVLNDYGYVGNVNNGNSVIAGTSGNLITSVSRSSASSAAALALGLPANGAYFNSYRVNVSDMASDPYYLFVANQDFAMEYSAGNGKNDKNGDGSADNDNNPFLSAGMTNVTFPVGSGSAAMYVFDIDVASHSELLKNLTIDIEFRRPDGGFPFFKSTQLINYVNPHNEWVHLTVVGDIATNKAYIYADGQLVTTASAYDAGQLNSATTLTAKSVRVNLGTNDFVPNVTKGESFGIDNMSFRFFSDGDSSLSTAVANSNITSWSGYTAGRGDQQANQIKLAPIASVNGVEYNDAAALEKALRTNEQLEVEFISTPSQPIVILANAKINTNRMDSSLLFTLGEGVEITKTEGKYVYTSAPHIPNINSVQIGNGTNSTQLSDLKDKTAGNTVGSTYEQNQGSFDIYSVTTEDDNDVFYMIKPRVDKTSVNTYMYIGYNSVSITESTIVVLDLDVATFTETINNFTLNVINRSSKGNSDGNGVPLENYVKPSDTWSHITLVVDFSTNKQHVFVNGAYAGEYGMANANQNNAGLSIADHIAAGNYASSSLRINMSGNVSLDKNDTTLIDNVYVKGYASNAAAGDIQSYIATGSLEGWANRVEGRTNEALPALATVDGVGYATPATLSKALVSNKEIQVEFLRQPILPATILANATVDTNGYDNVLQPDSACTVKVNGEIWKVTVPFLENKSETALTSDAALREAIMYSYPGNLLGNVGKVTNMSNAYDTTNPGLRIPTVVNSLFTGDTIYHETSDGTGGTGSATNEFLNFWNSSIIPLHTVSGQSQYFVMDVDVATAGSKTDSLFFQAYVRTSSTVGSGSGLWGGNITLTSLFTNPTNKMVHLTVVFDIDNNSFYTFVDGVYKTTGKVMSDAGHKYVTGADTAATAYFQGIKFGSNSNMDVYLNNYCMRYFNEADGGPIATAVSNKNLSTWSADFLTSGYQTTNLPAIANLNGAPAYNAEEIATATNTAFLNGQSVDIELLHNANVALTVNSTATINTHGFSATINAPESHAKYTDGNTVLVTAPNIYTAHETVANTLRDATKLNVANNLYSALQLVNYNKDGLRGSYLVKNLETGSLYGFDGLYNTGAEFTGSNSYFEFRPTNSKINYEFGNNQYIVYDFDVAIEDYTQAFPIAVVSRNSSNGGLWGNNINLSTYMNNLIPAGEFAHVTIALSGDTREVHLFINNEFIYTQTNGVGDVANAVSPFFETLRFCGGQQTSFFYDNVAIRTFNGQDGAALASAISAETLNGWANGIYVGGYAMPDVPTIAVVDGNNYNNASELEELFTTSREELDVEFKRTPKTPITISVDAVINTHGWSESLLVALGNNTTAKLNGMTLYVEGPFVESSTSTSTTTFPNLKDADATGNIVTSFSEGNPGAFNYFEITDFGSNDPYYMINPKVEKSETNTFITVNVNKKALTTNSYVIFEMDVATETDFVNQLKILNLNRTSSGGYGDGPGVPLQNYLNVSDDWAHIAIVFDYAEDTTHVFVNGLLVTPKGTTAPRAMSDVGKNNIGTDLTLNGFRINMGVGVDLSTAQSTLIDNVSVKYFADNTAAGDIESYISAKSAIGYANIETGRSGEALPTVATVNGVAYGNVNTANKAIAIGSDLYVTLEKSTVSGVTISAPATLVSNGLDYSISGALKITSSTGDVIIITAVGNIHVSVTVNGTVVYDGDVAPGTDINKILAEYGSVGNVVAGNGQIFTDVSWSKAPGVATVDTEFVGNGTKYKELFYVYDQNGAKVDTTYTADNFRTLIAEGGGKIRSFILNGNISVASGGGTPYSGQRNVYLNGYELSYKGGNHALSAPSSGNLTVSGPGTISDMNHTSTHYFLMGSYETTGVCTFKNLEMNLSSGLANLRGGFMVLENCTVNALSIFNSPLLQVGEQYNQGYTYIATSLDIIDSYINYRSYAGNTTLIKEKIVSGYKGGDENLPLTDPYHTVNISGSTIITEAALMESHETATWKDGGYTAVEAGDGVVSNMSLNIDNSTVIASSVWAGPKFLASVNIGNNTKINSALNNHATFGDVNIADGVVATKSNDHLADVTYTSFYANVTWSNGTTEKWAHGSTPVAPNALTKVDKVVGKNNYRFYDSYEEAPFYLSGNLTLGSDIAFNIYTGYEASIDAVIVNGETLTASEKLIGGSTLVWAYTVKLDPAYAAAQFDIIFKMSDGSTIVRAMSVANYASLVYANSNNTAEAKAVVSNTLNYIKATSVYFGVNADLSAINSLLSANPAVGYDLPTASDTNASAVNAYVTSIQLNVMSTLRFRFNLADGVDGNSVVIKVNGEKKETIVTGSYVELELRAYEMTSVITIEYSSASGTTDLAYYCAAVMANKGTSGTAARRYEQIYVRGGMLNAIFSYAMAASVYKATV